MPLNLESEKMPSRKWFKQTRKEIEKAKADFEGSGRIGGNPLGYPDDALKKDVLKNRR